MPTSAPRPPAEDIVLYSKDQATKIATITLNRPDRLNAPTAAARIRYADLVQRANIDDDVKVLLIRGVGEHFACDARAGSAEHRSNRDLARPLLHGERHHAVNPRGADDERQHAERGQERGVEAAIRGEVAEDVVEHANRRRRSARRHLRGDCGHDRGNHCSGRHRRADGESPQAAATLRQREIGLRS